MILNLNDKLFTKNPIDKFDISKSDWNRLWYKKKFLSYQPRELNEYVKTILHIDINPRTLYRYLCRYEVYLMAQSLIARKENTVHITYFPDNLVSYIKEYYNNN